MEVWWPLEVSVATNLLLYLLQSAVLPVVVGKSFSYTSTWYTICMMVSLFLYGLGVDSEFNYQCRH